jgi:hypothetical protein
MNVNKNQDYEHFNCQTFIKHGKMSTKESGQIAMHNYYY